MVELTLRERIEGLVDSGVDQEQDTDESDDKDTGESEDPRGDIESHLADDNGGESDQDDDQDESQGEDDQDDQDESSNSDDDDAGEGLSVTDLAEKLGIDPKEIYGLRFKYGETGESLTLGELKDLGGLSTQLQEDSESIVQERDDILLDRMRSRSELNSILAMMPEVSPEMMSEAKRQHTATVARERDSLLEILPEWADSAKENLAREAIAKNLADYGFNPLELTSILDHRMVFLLHDFTRLRESIRKPRAEIKRIQGRKGSKPRPRPKGEKGKKRQERAKAIAKEQGLQSGINSLFED